MITLDGKRPSELGFVVLAGHKNDILPEVESVTVSIPGKHGLYYLNSRFNARTFEIPCGIVQQKTWGDLQKIVRSIASFFVDQYGKPREIRLQFDYEPEKYYIVRYSGSLPIERLARTGRFILPLTAYDPFAYAPYNAYDPFYTVYYDRGERYDSGLMYKNIASFEWKYSTHYSYAYNYGYMETPLSLRITGSVINPRITNQTTGQTLIIGGSYDGEIYIDSNQFTVTFGGANLLNQTNGDFFMLASGMNTLIFEGGNPNATVEFVWKHRFV